MCDIFLIMALVTQDITIHKARFMKQKLKWNQNLLDLHHHSANLYLHTVINCKPLKYIENGKNSFIVFSYVKIPVVITYRY